MLKNTVKDHSLNIDKGADKGFCGRDTMASGPSVSLISKRRDDEDAVCRGAKLVVLPEYFCIMGMKDTDKLAVREQPGERPIQSFW